MRTLLEETAGSQQRGTERGAAYVPARACFFSHVIDTVLYSCHTHSYMLNRTPSTWNADNPAIVIERMWESYLHLGKLKKPKILKKQCPMKYCVALDLVEGSKKN